MTMIDLQRSLIHLQCFFKEVKFETKQSGFWCCSSKNYIAVLHPFHIRKETKVGEIFLLLKMQQAIPSTHFLLANCKDFCNWMDKR